MEVLFYMTQVYVRSNVYRIICCCCSGICM